MPFEAAAVAMPVLGFTLVGILIYLLGYTHPRPAKARSVIGYMTMIGLVCAVLDPFTPVSLRVPLAVAAGLTYPASEVLLRLCTNAALEAVRLALLVAFVWGVFALRLGSSLLGWLAAAAAAAGAALWLREYALRNSRGHPFSGA